MFVFHFVTLCWWVQVTVLEVLSPCHASLPFCVIGILHLAYRTMNSEDLDFSLQSCMKSNMWMNSLPPQKKSTPYTESGWCNPQKVAMCKGTWSELRHLLSLRWFLQTLMWKSMGDATLVLWGNQVISEDSTETVVIQVGYASWTWTKTGGVCELVFCGVCYPGGIRTLPHQWFA